MTTAHQPTAGSAIVCALTRVTLGYWTLAAPAFQHGQRLRFIPPQKMPISYSRMNDADWEQVVLTYDVWLTWGDLAQGGHQVWLTTATEPMHLRGLRGVRPVIDNDYAKDAEAVRRVMDMNAPIHFDRAYLESYARYLEDKADAFAGRAA